MSLNRTEQRLFDYIWANAEERQYWQTKVQTIAAGAGDPHAAPARIDTELWHYYRERSGIVADLREAAQREGPARTSMKNLAEFLLRQWVAPRPKPPAVPGPGG
jgi:hypothetical protein